MVLIPRVCWAAGAAKADLEAAATAGRAAAAETKVRLETAEALEEKPRTAEPRRALGRARAADIMEGRGWNWKRREERDVMRCGAIEDED